MLSICKIRQQELYSEWWIIFSILKLLVEDSLRCVGVQDSKMQTCPEISERMVALLLKINKDLKTFVFGAHYTNYDVKPLGCPSLGNSETHLSKNNSSKQIMVWEFSPLSQSGTNREWMNGWTLSKVQRSHAAIIRVHTIH